LVQFNYNSKPTQERKQRLTKSIATNEANTAQNQQ
jgi:hypothetical protein